MLRTITVNDLSGTECPRFKNLGLNVAVDMAQNGLVKGVGAQRPYDQGVTEELLAGYGLLGKPAPAYVALPALPVEIE